MLKKFATDRKKVIAKNTDFIKCLIQGGPENITHPYLLKLLQVAEILLIILFQNEKVP